MFTKIKSIKPLGVKTVYDITVAKDHSYVANGIVHHNSSEDPNLQNIPRPLTNPDIKKMFTALKGMMLWELDYSQAELRVVAELSGDKAMIDIFASGRNIHVATAARMAKVTEEEIQVPRKDENHPKHDWAVKMHKKAKTYNFGILYGQTAKKLAQTIHEATGEPLDIKGAEQGLKDWFKAFPGVARWIKGQHKFVREEGYVMSIFGRKRRLPNIWSSSFWIMLEAERQSVNAPIQSAASDFTLFTSIIIREEILKGNLPNYLRPQVYTVHDSIGYYIYPKDVQTIVPKLSEIAANPQTLKWFGFEMKSVRMKASFEGGLCWGELHEHNSKENYEEWFEKAA